MAIAITIKWLLSYQSIRSKQFNYLVTAIQPANHGTACAVLAHK